MVTYPRAEADLAVWSESALRPPFLFCSLPPSPTSQAATVLDGHCRDGDGDLVESIKRGASERATRHWASGLLFRIFFLHNGGYSQNGAGRGLRGTFAHGYMLDAWLVA